MIVPTRPTSRGVERREEIVNLMTKLKLLSAALTAAAMLATPAMARMEVVALEPKLLGVSRGASRRFLASSILILISPSGLKQSCCSPGIALNKQFCKIESARLQGLGPLTLRDMEQRHRGA
jgi:hypothetical protein